MGRDRRQSRQGGEAALKLGVSAPAHTCPPAFGFASATLPVKGRGTRVRRGLERQHDPIHHPVQVAPDLASPEPQHSVSMSRQDPIPDSIVRRLDILTVLAAIDFDGDPPGVADEVEIVAAKRRLAAEVKASVTEPFQPRPEHDLRLAHVAPQIAGASNFGTYGPI